MHVPVDTGIFHLASDIRHQQQKETPVETDY